MTTKELLKPRWKVIADFPCNVGQDVGEIISECEYKSEPDCYFVKIDLDGKIFGICPDDYPHLFKKLKWWEERDIKDLPDYIKKIDTEVVYKVLWNRYDNPPKCVGIWFNREGIDVCFDGQDQDFSLLTIYKPATEQEYLNQ